MALVYLPEQSWSVRYGASLCVLLSAFAVREAFN